MSLISLRHSRQSRAVGPSGRTITAASRLGAGPEVGEQAAQLHYEQPTVLAFCISLYRFVDSKGHAMHIDANTSTKDNQSTLLIFPLSFRWIFLEFEAGTSNPADA